MNRGGRTHEIPNGLAHGSPKGRLPKANGRDSDARNPPDTGRGRQSIAGTGEVESAPKRARVSRAAAGTEIDRGHRSRLHVDRATVDLAAAHPVGEPVDREGQHDERAQRELEPVQREEEERGRDAEE